MIAKNNNIPIWVVDYIGIEFKEIGRGKMCDCWGLVKKILWEKFNIKAPTYDQYESTKELERLNSLIEFGMTEDQWCKIPKNEELLGDVILFKIRGQLCHVGFCLGNDNMLHIQKGKNACIESYNEIRWGKRLHSFYRHRSLMV